jgi:hypothetical protein
MSEEFVQYPTFGGIPTYATVGSLPASAPAGSLAVVLSNDTLYVWDATLMTWKVVGPSSGGTPGGTPGQVQYNNSGAFGGFGSWDGTILHIPETIQIGDLPTNYFTDNLFIGDNLTDPVLNGDAYINLVALSTITLNTPPSLTSGFASLLLNPTLQGSANMSGILAGIFTQPTYSGSGSISQLSGIFAGPVVSGGTITSAYALNAQIIAESGAITNTAALYINTPIDGASVTNNFGLYIEDQSGVGSNNYNIYSAGADSVNKFEGTIETSTLNDTSMALSIDVNNRILYGSDGITQQLNWSSPGLVSIGSFGQVDVLGSEIIKSEGDYLTNPSLTLQTLDPYDAGGAYSSIAFSFNQGGSSFATLAGINVAAVDGNMEIFTPSLTFSGVINDTSAAVSIDSNNRLDYANDGTTSIDWQNRNLVAAGATAMNWSNGAPVLPDYTTITTPVEGMIAWNFTTHALTTYNGTIWT